ncbi:hypothetical protein GC163_00250 [bacterium]|nr:hypothetical protein [bacterium]
MRQCSFLAWTGSLALLLVGCNASSSTSEFRTYDQLLTQESKETPSPSTDAVPTESEPVAAESTGTETAGNDVNEGSRETEIAAEIPASALAPLNLVDGTSAGEILNVVAKSAPTTDMPAVNTNDPSALPVITVKPGGIQVLVPDKNFKHEGRDQALRVSYDDLDLLKVLNMEPVPDDATKYFPEWLQQLHGQKVRIRGFMYPTFESSGIEQFVLARDNQICCFGRDPKVYDLISVTLQPNKPTDYIPNRPFDVVGTFHIDLLAEGGKPLGLYWLEDAQVVDR